MSAAGFLHTPDAEGLSLGATVAHSQRQKILPVQSRHSDGSQTIAPGTDADLLRELALSDALPQHVAAQLLGDGPCSSAS